MSTACRTVCHVAISLFVLTASTELHAAGSKSKKSSKKTSDPAVKHFNTGIKHRDKAWKLEKEAERYSGEEYEKRKRRIRAQYEKAIEAFQAATKANRKYHEAWGSLGYALRKTGEYEEALRAYNWAVSLKPDYAEAIEYRGEAYLALNRMEDAKVAYYQLLPLDEKLASKLLDAMEEWVQAQRMDPSEDVSNDLLDQAEAWLESKKKRSEGLDSDTDW